MVGVLQALVLGLLQGVTEWLPISSSGHLVLAQQFMRVDVPVFFDLVLHLGTLFAVLAVYRKDVLGMFGAVFRRDLKSEYGRLAAYLVVASIPTAIIGFAFYDYVSGLFSNLLAVGVALIITGTVLYSTRKFSGEKELNAKHSVLVGIAQGLAIVPGISRSGMTISASMLLGVNRGKAARFSLLLSVPAIVGASIFEPFMSGMKAAFSPALAAGFVTSLIVGYASIKILLRILSHDGFYKFSYYCWIVGAITVASQVV